MSNRFFIIVLVVVGLVFGGFVLSSRGDKQSSSSAEPTNHTLGAGTSGVTLTEYGDFQCPACGSFYPVVKQVKQEFGDQITFQFRHFPLVQIHQHALLASRAAEAAGFQGKFFEMHDRLFETQSSWTSLGDPLETFVDFAKQLELNEEQFRADMVGQQANDNVLADIEAAKSAGAESTPTFVINGRKLDQNPGSLEDFISVIQAEIDAKKQDQ